jgi:hypothetical protein
MRIGTAILGMLARPELSPKKIGLYTVLLVTVASGCSSVISNSADFYKDMPRRRINWREYLTD